MLIYEERPKRTWKKEPLHTRTKSSVEQIMGKHLTDQSGALSKAKVVLALQRGAVMPTTPLEYGHYQPANSLAEALDNALVQSYATFEGSVLPAIEKAQADAKKAADAAKNNTSAGVAPVAGGSGSTPAQPPTVPVNPPAGT